MDLNGLLDNVHLPDGAREQLKALNLQAQNLGNGAAMFSGHDQGVAYRLFEHDGEKNATQSKLLGYNKYDKIDMIEWVVDRTLKPTERVKFLPPGLLEFNEYTREPVGGRYLQDYLAYKKGLESPGLLLSRWGELAGPELRTLSDEGIFSVEQFAAKSREWMARFSNSPELMEAYDKAINYVSEKQNRVDAETIAAQFEKLEKKNLELQAQIEAMKEKKKPAKKKEATPEPEEGEAN